MTFYLEREESQLRASIAKDSTILLRPTNRQQHCMCFECLLDLGIYPRLPTAFIFRGPCPELSVPAIKKLCQGGVLFEGKHVHDNDLSSVRLRHFQPSCIANHVTPLHPGALLYYIVGSLPGALLNQQRFFSTSHACVFDIL